MISVLVHDVSCNWYVLLRFCNTLHCSNNTQCLISHILQVDSFSNQFSVYLQIMLPSYYHTLIDYITPHPTGMLAKLTAQSTGTDFRSYVLSSFPR